MENLILHYIELTGKTEEHERKKILSLIVDTDHKFSGNITLKNTVILKTCVLQK